MLKLFLAVAFYRLCTVPLGLRAVQFKIAAARLAPQVEAIKAAHPNDWITANKLTTQLYRQNGLNPAAGCLMPAADILIFLAALCFASPGALLAEAGFLWVADLAKYDGLIPLAWLSARYGQTVLVHRLIGQKHDPAQLSGAFVVLGILVWGLAWGFQWPAYVFAFWILMDVFYAVIATAAVLTTKAPQSAPATTSPAASPSPAATPPSPSSPQPAQAPSPPAPALPTPVSPPMPVSPPATCPGTGPSPLPAAKPFDLAAEIARASPGATIRIHPPVQNVEGPIVIRKPVTIEGESAAIWANHGPVVSIESDGVALHNLSIEITDNAARLVGAAACALVVRAGLNPTFDRVSVRGDVEGVAAEDGPWRYPRAIDLGTVEAGHPHEFRLRVAVPVRCELTSDIAGLRFRSREICHPEEVALLLDPIPAGTRLRGSVALHAPALTRTIVVSGNVSASASAAAPQTGTLLYEPDDWDVVRLGPPPPPKPTPAQPPAPTPTPSPALTPTPTPTAAPPNTAVSGPTGPAQSPPTRHHLETSVFGGPAPSPKTPARSEPPARSAPPACPAGSEMPEAPSRPVAASEQPEVPPRPEATPPAPATVPPPAPPAGAESPKSQRHRKIVRGGDMGLFGDSVKKDGK